MLVEVTTVEQLVERLRKGKYKSNSEIVDKSTYELHRCVTMRPLTAGQWLKLRWRMTTS